MIQVTPVFFCGGSGARLCHLSRTGFPKQSLRLTGTASLFQQAALRLISWGNSVLEVAAPFIVKGEEYRFLASEQLRKAGILLGAALVEPIGRNTGPRLTISALPAIEKRVDPILVVTPADQTVEESAAFTTATYLAIEQAAEVNIVIFGITPNQPETGYGYIHTETNGSLPLQANVSQDKAFVEKPDAATAQRYLDEGGYFWNAGMFVLRASVWLKALEQFRPEFHQATLRAWTQRSADANTVTLSVRPGEAEFTPIPQESVDYAVMGRCPDNVLPIHIVLLNAGWNGRGAWTAVWNVLPKGEYGNVHVGYVLSPHSSNTLAHASSISVSLVGVSDLVVVKTADAVLVARKSYSQDVKHIVNQLTARKREEHTMHRKVRCPCSWYVSIDQGCRFKVKRIHVKRKASLSLQKHHHLAEHWIVVTGTAELTNGEKILNLTENQSTYIPLGEVHCTANPGSIPLEIIQVQPGADLSENYFVRLKDAYGRN